MDDIEVHETARVGECIIVKNANESRIKSNGMMEFKKTAIDSVHSAVGCNFVTGIVNCKRHFESIHWLPCFSALTVAPLSSLPVR